MKVDRATQDLHRARLLAAGSRLFRDRGVGGVSVAEVSAAAGLTHGAFYGHYASKAELARASCQAAAAASVERWRGLAESARAESGDPLGAIIDAYLSMSHCSDPGAGCALAALGGEAGRPDNAHLAAVLGEMVQALTGVLAEELAHVRPLADAAVRRSAAQGALAAMQGGIVLARTLRQGPGGAAAADEVLAAARVAARRALD